VSWSPACSDVSKDAEERPPLPIKVIADTILCDGDL
jgi:hypothetical protein